MEAVRIFTSKHPPLGTLRQSVPEAVLANAARAPRATALIDGLTGERVDYGELAGRVRTAAAALADGGFRPGDVLGIRAPNAPRWANQSLGAMLAGGAVTGVHPAATEDEAAAQLADAEAAMVIGDHEAEAAASRPEGGSSHATGGHEAEAAARRPEHGSSHATGGHEGLRARRSRAQVQLDLGALAFLPYSSGTTGRPKGVMLTHRNLAVSVAQVGSMLDLKPGDVVLAVAPFAHVMGFLVTLAAPLAAGATVVTMPRFDVRRALSIVERHRVTVMVVPPPVMAALARDPEVGRYDLSSLELVVSGGAPLGAALHRAVATRLPHAVVGQGYGLTETAVGVSAPDRRTGSLPGSVGRLMPSTELRVVDPDSGADVELGAPGELWVRGPQVMAGYRGAPEATAEILAPGGWLRTGDLGRVDQDGNLFVVDRLKELIKVNALQVAPAELEDLLLTRPEISDAAVIPRPDERTGEAPVAVVVTREPLDPEALMDWVAERVARHKRIRHVRFVDAIPRTPAGKILRRRLVQEERERAAAVHV